MLMRYLALGVGVALASAALAQGDQAPRPQPPPLGSPDKSDDVPRPDDLLPPKSGRPFAPREERESQPGRPIAPREERESQPGRPSAPPEPRGSPPGLPRPSERWGAVAYTADGAFGAAYGIDTKDNAERLAIDECQRESTDKQDCGRGVVARQDTWFHIQFCRRGGDWTTQITSRPTLAETTQAAAQYARTSKYGADGCHMVPNGLFHSGGIHTKM